MPEHTLEASAYAHALGADAIALAVVHSRDGYLLACSNIFLDDVTDVAARFPRRARADGRYYVIDFDLREIRTLHVHQQAHPRTGIVLRPGRFPAALGDFHLTTVDKHLELIRGLNQSTGRSVEVHFEIKQPLWHAAQGRRFLSELLETVARCGFEQPGNPSWVGCADANALGQLRQGLDHPVRLLLLHDDDPTALPPDSNDATSPSFEDIVPLISGAAVPWTLLARQPETAPATARMDWASLQQIHGLHLYTIMHDVPRIPSPPRRAIASVSSAPRPEKYIGIYTDFPDRARAWSVATNRYLRLTESLADAPADLATACG